MAEGKKSRKFGRNKVACTRYKAGARDLVNKRKRMLRHAKSNPLCAVVVSDYKRIFGKPLPVDLNSKGKKLLSVAGTDRFGDIRCA